MRPEQYERIKTLFTAALDLPPGEQAAYVDMQSSDDLVVHAEVTRLLAMRTGDSSLTTSTRQPNADQRQPGQRIAHYRLVRMLGAGGMGEVWLAEDTALGRHAALKLLRSEMGNTLRERLLRESEASARLQHPAIATFYEAGEHEGLTWLAMEYVEGSTLRERLRGGALPVAEAIGLGQGLLEGLVHAHSAGVLHRDIKPENIILTSDGRIKLLDFGLARWVGGFPPETELADGQTIATPPQLTAHGAVTGTIGYMPPEQLRGELTDVRSDVFAASAVIYEMLTGRQAFPGRDIHERMAAIRSRDPDPLVGAVFPAELNEALMRAMKRESGARYAGAAEFLTDLRRVGKGLDLSTLPNTIAILDFENLTGQARDDWIGRGLAESMLVDLSRVPGLEPLSRDVVMARVAELGRESSKIEPLNLGRRAACRWILVGAYQRLASTLRVTLRLIDSGTGAIVVSEKRDGAPDDLFGIQDRLASTVAEHLKLGHTSFATEPSLGVYECYERGMLLAERFGKEQMAQAVGYLRRAIELDPGYVPALAELAKASALRFGVTGNPEDLQTATDFARRALAVDPHSGQARAWLGYALWRSRRTEEAIGEERRAVDAAPDRFDPPYFLGCMLLEAGRAAEALAFLQRSLQIDSKLSWTLAALGTAHLALGRPAESRWAYERAHRVQSLPQAVPFPGTLGLLAMWHRYHGSLDQARSHALRSLEEIETSDHVFRDGFRAAGLCLLGEVTMDQRDLDAARVAFDQAVAQMRGRPHGAGQGWVMRQALAGLARATGEAAPLDVALALETSEPDFDFSFAGWTAPPFMVLAQMAQAAAALARDAQAHELLLEARTAGLPPALEPPLVGSDRES